MLQTRSAILVIALAVTASAFSSFARAEDEIAAVPDAVLAQARWAKAERDKSNALLAKDFLRSDSSQGVSGDTDGLPSATTEAPSDKTD